MIARSVNAAADVIARAMVNGKQTPAGWAMALDATGMLQTPETAAELTRLRERFNAAPAELSPEQRTALDEQLGDAKPATTGLIVSFGQSIANRRNHEHPTWEDLYCMNLSSYMGERMAPVLRRLLDVEAEAAQLRARLAEFERPVDEDPIAYEMTPKAKAAADKLTRLLAPLQALREDESAEEQAVRRSVDAQFPKVAAFLAEEKTIPAPGTAVTPGPTSPEPDRELPQIAVGCPACHAKPGDLCTSHSGTRPRRDNTHQARSAAWANTQKGGTA
ncbi:hypothetical protein [Streptomyces sp. NPDC050988]|uniref:zinc finger domain-containing protein n=1 Tax=Streptomyces sp. NPDC050988 TaxID=3365637 RepID=UPI0037A55AB3